MKLAFLLPGGGRSGGVRCTVIAANRLLARGHEVRILYRRTGFHYRGLFSRVTTRVLHGKPNNWLDDFHGSALAYGDIREVEFPPNEILIGAGMWCSAQLGKLDSLPNPKLQYIHGLTPWDPDLMDAALSLPLPKIGVSHVVAEKVTASYDGNLFLGVVHNGIELDQYFPSVPDGQRDGIGTIYGRHPAKAPAVILESLARLRRELSEVPQYVFGAPLRPRTIPRSAYRQDPSVSEARDLYSRSLVWILASRSEGFPGPVLEAMACGCAVVATDCGGPRDVIVDGRNGFLVDVDNVDQIVDRVVRVIHDEDLRRGFSREGQETAGRFSWDNAVSQLEEILGSLVQ